MFNKVKVSSGTRKRNQRVNLGGFQATTLDFCHNKVLAADLCMPGDKININLSHVMQMSPLVGTVVGKCSLDFKSFFVPARLAYRGFEQLMDNMDVISASGSVSPSLPKINNILISSMFMRYFGFNVKTNLLNEQDFVASPWDGSVDVPQYVQPLSGYPANDVIKDFCLAEVVGVASSINPYSGKPHNVLHFTNTAWKTQSVGALNPYQYPVFNLCSVKDDYIGYDYDGKDYDFIGMPTSGFNGINQGRFNFHAWQSHPSYYNESGAYVASSANYPYFLYKFTNLGKRLFDLLCVCGLTPNFCCPAEASFNITHTNGSDNNITGVFSNTANWSYTSGSNTFAGSCADTHNMNSVVSDSGVWALEFDMRGNKVNSQFDLTYMNVMKLLAFMKIYQDYLCPSYWSKEFTYQIEPYLNGKKWTYDSFIPFSMLLTSCYDKDYFTSAWLNPNQPNNNFVTDSRKGTDAQQIVPLSLSEQEVDTDTTGTYALASSDSSTVLSKVALDMVNALHKMSRITNLAGSRYIDQLFAKFGVRNSNARLQRCELLDVMRSRFDIQTVVSTASTEEASLGDYTAHGSSRNSGKLGSIEVSEWGYLFVICSITPIPSYYQGRQRDCLYTEAKDFYDPILDGVDAMQSVRMDELLADNRVGPAFWYALNKSVYKPDGTFGYSRLFAEMKKGRDILGGDFRLDSRGKYTNSSYHLFREIPNLSQLAAANTPLVNGMQFNLAYDGSQYNRVFQLVDSDYDHFQLYMNLNIYATRNEKGMTDFTFDDECDSVDRTISNNGSQSDRKSVV